MSTRRNFNYFIFRIVHVSMPYFHPIVWWRLLFLETETMQKKLCKQIPKKKASCGSLQMKRLAICEFDLMGKR